MIKQPSTSAILLRSRAHLATASANPAVGPVPKLKLENIAPAPPTGTMAAQPAEPPSQDKDKGQQGRRPTGPYFPLGYKDAAYQWWTSVTPPMAERNVLSLIPHIREATGHAADSQDTAKADPFGTRIWKSTMVQLSGKNRGLNEFSVEREGEEVDENLVMLHGYGAGLGFFYKNYEALTRLKGWKLYSLDMLGMGNSTRPPFKIHAKDRQGKIREAEDWFIDALEEWRIKRNLDKFTLLGHSLGGYLAVSYALKYPGRLKKLILASPVGIPEDPYAVAEELPEPGESTMANEFTQDQQSVVYDKDRTAMKTQTAPGQNSTDAQKKPLPGWLVWLWDANVSPFSLVRMSGPFGPRFVSGWTSRRFNHLPADEARLLHDYSFAIFRQRGSGEYALPYILAPGAYARDPIINRIQGVGRQAIPSPDKEGGKPVRETGIPIVLMYGDKDWMDVAGGFAAQEKLKEAKLKVLLHGSDEEKRGENGSAKVVIIKDAGHHLYLDNPEDFNEAIRKEMEETGTDELRKKKAGFA